MTSLLLGSVKDFGRRIRVVGLVPAGIFVAVVLALVAAGAPGEAPNLGRLAARVGGLAAWQGVCLLLAVVVLVVLVQPAQLSLIRVLEGYGGRSAPAVRLADWRRARHATRRAALDSATRVPADQPVDHDVRRRLALADHELRVRYPPTADLMPTALGNALRAAESRAGRRYALEAVTMWPRLYAILPDRVARLIDDQREQLDLAANLCIAMILTAAVSTALLATHGWWLLLPVGALGLAWLAYRGACATAIIYGDSLEVAFDLHRFDLLRALHLPLPAALSEERAANRELTAFLLQELPVALSYIHPEPPPLAVLAPQPAAPGGQPDGASGQGASPEQAEAAAEPAGTALPPCDAAQPPE